MRLLKAGGGKGGKGGSGGGTSGRAANEIDMSLSFIDDKKTGRTIIKSYRGLISNSDI